MKATRFNFYRDGMEPERSGGWVRVSQLPKHVQDEFVEPVVIPEDWQLEDDNDDDA